LAHGVVVSVLVTVDSAVVEVDVELEVVEVVSAVDDS
jgi:hypothetical protein